jgi:hypothetical protein
MYHAKLSSVLKNSSGKIVYHRHEMTLSVKFHPMGKADEIVDCKTSSSLTDFLTKTMNDGFKFCWKLQTTISLKVSDRVMY